MVVKVVLMQGVEVVVTLEMEVVVILVVKLVMMLESEDGVDVGGKGDVDAKR